MPGTVRLVDAQGVFHDVPEEQAQLAVEHGLRAPTSDEQAARLGAQAREADYGGVGGGIRAAGTALARGATLGLSDLAARALGGEQAAADLDALREENPLISAGGELVGTLAPALLSGGAATPAGLAARAGAGVRELGAGAGMLGQVGAAALGGVTEGALYGAGQGLSEVALSQDPLTWERAASTIGSNMLFGGAIGGIAGAGSSLVERGLQRAGRAIDEGMAARAAADAVPGDLSGLDAAGLREARAAEVERLAGDKATQRAAARSSVVDDMLTYRSTVQDANPWLAVTEGEDAARLTKANRALRNALDDAKGLRENPTALAKPLRVEEQSLENAIANRAELAQKLEAANQKIAKDLGENLATLPDSATHVELSGKAARRYASYADVKLPKGGALSVARDDAQGFLDALASGEVSGEGRQALDKLPDLLEQNRAMQARIKAATAPLTPKAELASERLTAIDAARDALASPAAASMAEQAFSGTAFGAITGLAHAIPGVGSIPGVAHFVGAKGAELASRLVFGKLGEAVGAAGERAVTAAKSFIDVASKAAPLAPVLATKVLGGLRYARERDGEEQPKSLPELYRKRTDEVKALTAYDETGVPKMRPAARQAVADQLRPIGAASPVLADRLEALAARRIEYLSSIMPRRPDLAGLQTGPDRWQPSEMEMRSWARSAAALEDPHAVFERAIHGQVTPEDISAMRAVYPEMLSSFISEVSAQLPTLRATLPHERRLALSMLTGQPVDPALDPRVLRVLQGQFTDEVGTAGGTQAPKAMPQFGSLKKSPDAPTPAQNRAQGAHA